MEVATRHTIQPLGPAWEQSEIVIASHAGPQSRKRLIMRVKYNGSGESQVRFVLNDRGNVTTFGAADDAVAAYNEAA